MKSVINNTFKIINPEKEKPGLIKRFGKHTSIDGCFLPFVFIGILYVSIKKLFGLSQHEKKGNYITFNQVDLSYTQGALEQKINYSDMENLELHFNSEDFIDDSDYKEYSKIQFTSGGVQSLFHITGNKIKARSSCKKLYENRINFKEFRNGKRVFLGKSKKYKEIQELKKKYGIEW
ncbi:MAG: hypothetical protein P1U56_19755 [Saprospiraceae bacterium]|nr:hypothetical protein [Saprospiraceae bacterium]